MKNIIIIAPFPPPVTGVSTASEKIIERLSSYYNFIKIDFSRKNLNVPAFSIEQLKNVITTLLDIIKVRKRCDIAYIIVSQSKFGNLKDLLYILLLRKKKIIIHLHGGGIKKIIFDKSPIQLKINKIFMRWVDFAVVLSNSLSENYSKLIDDEKIVVIENFADEKLFFDNSSIIRKYNLEKKDILYMSNLIPGKGYLELLDGFLNLPDDIRMKYNLNFAGSFANDFDKLVFFEKIENHDNIRYHGIVHGNEKIALFERAMIFCLPSYFPYMEGQPISILEAYASGCVVFSTDHGGIKDIFTDKINGFEVEKASAISITNKLLQMHNTPVEALINIGISNRAIAEKIYTEQRYINDINYLFSNVG